MEKYETQSKEVHIINEELSTIFRLLSNHDAVKIFYSAGMGIKNSTYAIEELDLTPKRYYYRLKELMAADLVKKVDDVYRQTALGRTIYDRFLPEIGKTVNAKDKLELIARLEGTELESEFKKLIEHELEIPIFAESTNVKAIDNYESMVIDVIDICDSATESILLASNYFDIRVMEATMRSQERGVTNRIILGRKNLSSKLQQLKMMLSPVFAMAVINFASKAEELNEMVRIVDLDYSFCVVDGHRIILKVSDAAKGDFLAAFSVNDWKIGKRLTDSYEELWKNGEVHTALKFLSSLKSS